MTSREIEWVLVDTDEFLKLQQRIEVIWFADFAHTETSVRQVLIKSNLQWKSFSRSCLLPWYKDNKDWSYPDSEHYTLVERAKLQPIKLREDKDLLIRTAYHTLINKRLIVDGCKRAVALETESNKGREIPEVRVLKCYGPQIHSIFPMDFTNLIVKELRSHIPSCTT